MWILELHGISTRGNALVIYRQFLRPCRKETVGNSRSEWIIIPDMHPAIVTEDEYNRAQEMIGSHGRKNMATEAYFGEGCP
ncbi:MAG: recombinase family protein, partial [Oscillospiraceae bacterium]|nr:recombinase family protein [Oscillospiraceae bacterium]